MKYAGAALGLGLLITAIAIWRKFSPLEYVESRAPRP